MLLRRVKGHVATEWNRHTAWVSAGPATLLHLPLPVSWAVSGPKGGHSQVDLSGKVRKETNWEVVTELEPEEALDFGDRRRPLPQGRRG